MKPPCSDVAVNKEDTTEIAALSWILELPRDLGLREDTAAAIATERTPLPGWEGRFDRIPDWLGDPPDVVPHRRLRFRRARVGIGMPAEATNRVYGELRGMRGLQKLRYRMRLRALSWRGAKEWKTICQLTQWYLGDDIPDPSEEDFEFKEDSPLRTDLAAMLEELDLWLQTYGSVSGEVDIGSIALHDLPAEVPWFIQTRSSPDSYDLIQSGTLPIHGRLPNLQPAQGDDAAVKMASFVAAQGPEAFPLFTSTLLLFQAQGHALAGRGRQAAIDMGTAVEGVVLRVIRDAMTIRGRTETEIEATLDRRWKDLFNRDLLEILDVRLGQADACHSKWWSQHYRLRIDAVHGGSRIPQDLAMEAVVDSWELIDWIGNRLREQPDLAPMGEVLRIKQLQPSNAE